MKYLFIIYVLLFSTNAFAISDKGNGGDICENRFLTIRDDIASWILSEGGAGLDLPFQIGLDRYNSEMLKSIKNAKIACVQDTLKIRGFEKICVNYIDPIEGPMIICNQNVFLNLKVEDQYFLVHHEYAGLSGFEVNDGEQSNYVISNQISAYLKDQIVKKLAIKNAPIILKTGRYNSKTNTCDLYVTKSSDNMKLYLTFASGNRNKYKYCDRELFVLNYANSSHYSTKSIHAKMINSNHLSLTINNNEYLFEFDR